MFKYEQEGPDSVVNPSLDEHGIEQLRTLSLEKDLLRNAINSSHDNRISHIGKVEDVTYLKSGFFIVFVVSMRQ